MEPNGLADEDPWAILGVPVDADDRQVRAAYLQKVKEHPPDRSAEQFERIRDAYDELRDPRRRAERLIRSVDPAADLVSLLDDGADARRFVGPEPWLAAMKQAPPRASADPRTGAKS
jgi:curved DNA-binding protein CbpA